MSNYPSQDHPSQDHPAQQQSSGRFGGRDDQFSHRDPYRDHEYSGQRPPQSNRGAAGSYSDSPYNDREFYEQNPLSSNYGAYRGRGQHREPWPRNEDRENYSAAGDYGQNTRGFGQGAGYGQSYGGPSPDYGQVQESARWREQQQYSRSYAGDRQPGAFYRQGTPYRQSTYDQRGNYGWQGSGWQGNGQHDNYGVPSQQGLPRDIPQPGYFQAGDFSHQSGYTSSEYPEDTGYLYSAPPYSRGNQQAGSSLRTQGWQEREGAQRGAFGLQNSHRGRGPQGYSRSDERIREDVCERLSEHHYIDASQIRVEVNQGVVTLEGSVDDRWQKYQTEDLVDATSGVKDIQNRLNVSRTSRQSAQWTSQPASPQTATAQQASDNAAGKRNVADKSGDPSRGKSGLGNN